MHFVHFKDFGSVHRLNYFIQLRLIVQFAHFNSFARFAYLTRYFADENSNIDIGAIILLY